MPKPKKKRKPLTLAERLQKTIDKHNKRVKSNMAMFRAEQKRQGLKPDEPIDLMKMLTKE